MQRAGRSKGSTSYQTYINNYTNAFGNRLDYVRDGGRAVQLVQFRQSMLSWTPVNANRAVCKDLSDSQKTALQHAVEPTQRYSANASTSPSGITSSP